MSDCAPSQPSELARSVAGRSSLHRIISWHRAELTTEAGDKLTAWVLKADGRIILTCVSPNGAIEPVTKEDRRMVGEGVALMLPANDRPKPSGSWDTQSATPIAGTRKRHRPQSRRAPDERDGEDTERQTHASSRGRAWNVK